MSGAESELIHEQLVATSAQLLQPRSNPLELLHEHAFRQLKLDAVSLDFGILARLRHEFGKVGLFELLCRQAQYDRHGLPRRRSPTLEVLERHLQQRTSQFRHEMTFLGGVEKCLALD